jgi:hypothetical protein
VREGELNDLCWLMADRSMSGRVLDPCGDGC